MSHLIKNNTEYTIEIIIPSWANRSGSDVQILIERSMAHDVSKYSDSATISNLPRIRDLVIRGMIEEVII